MRRFRLLKQEGYDQLVAGRSYEADHGIVGAAGFRVSVLGLVSAYPNDWVEVGDEEARICAIEAKIEQIDKRMDELLNRLARYNFDREFYD